MRRHKLSKRQRPRVTAERLERRAKVRAQALVQREARASRLHQMQLERQEARQQEKLLKAREREERERQQFESQRRLHEEIVQIEDRLRNVHVGSSSDGGQAPLTQEALANRVSQEYVDDERMEYSSSDGGEADISAPGTIETVDDPLEGAEPGAASSAPTVLLRGDNPLFTIPETKVELVSPRSQMVLSLIHI